SLLAFAGGGGVKMLQLRETLVFGLIGLIFLASVAIGRPLIYPLARAGVRRRAPDKVQVVEALRGDVPFRRSMMVATLVWGFGLLAACALNCALVFIVSIQHFLLIHGPINYAVIGLMTAWTFWYVPSAMRRAAVRLAAADQAKPSA
ncbi:VC0807 family protein, partial [Roseiarcus sp.]|uniref:VC0807 family protein n=1 Tax=Roseiarcus sp. TaxID=1969460 RepID=UPI003D11DC9D